jgi:hypothetical protein
MDPFTLSIIGALTVAVAIPIVVVKTLRFLNDIAQWFRERIKLMLPGKRIAFGLAERLKNGQYTYHQGVFDVGEEKLVDAKRYRADQLDTEMMEAHRRDDLVIYN